MKIVHCIYSMTIGGAETMLVDILNEQIKMAEVSLIVVNDLYDADLVRNIDKNVRIYFCKRRLKSKSPAPFLRLNYFLYKIKPDIIHCHARTLINFIVYHCPKILTNHTGDIETKYFNRYALVIAISKVTEYEIKEKNNTVKVIQINNGISTNKIHFKKNHSIDKALIKIIQVARLVPEIKGQDILINVCADLQDEGYNIHLTLIGVGVGEDYLKILARERNIEKNIIFMGNKSREYIYNNLHLYDIMVHPSRYEGFGLTVAEGMSAGLPVLVSNNDGPYEIINYGEYGFSFASGNEDDCKNKLKHIIDKYNSLSDKCYMAREWVEHKYSIERLVKNYDEVYKSLLCNKL